MSISIEFHYEARGRTIEVNDIFAKWLLTRPEQPIETPVAQLRPKLSLCSRHAQTK